MEIMDVIKMSAKAWSEVKVKVIKKSWKKKGVWSNTEEPTQADDEDEDTVADFREIIVQQPGPQPNNIHVAGQLACDAALDGQETTNEEIQDTVTNQEEEEEEIPCQFIGPNAQEVIQSADVMIVWLTLPAD